MGDPPPRPVARDQEPAQDRRPVIAVRAGVVPDLQHRSRWSRSSHRRWYQRGHGPRAADCRRPHRARPACAAAAARPVRRRRKWQVVARAGVVGTCWRAYRSIAYPAQGAPLDRGPWTVRRAQTPVRRANSRSATASPSLTAPPRLGEPQRPARGPANVQPTSVVGPAGQTTYPSFAPARVYGTTCSPGVTASTMSATPGHRARSPRVRRVAISLPAAGRH